MRLRSKGICLPHLKLIHRVGGSIVSSYQPGLPSVPVVGGLLGPALQVACPGARGDNPYHCYAGKQTLYTVHACGGYNRISHEVSFVSSVSANSHALFRFSYSAPTVCGNGCSGRGGAAADPSFFADDAAHIAKTQEVNTVRQTVFIMSLSRVAWKFQRHCRNDMQIRQAPFPMSRCGVEVDSIESCAANDLCAGKNPRQTRLVQPCLPVEHWSLAMSVSIRSSGTLCRKTSKSDASGQANNEGTPLRAFHQSQRHAGATAVLFSSVVVDRIPENRWVLGTSGWPLRMVLPDPA